MVPGLPEWEYRLHGRGCCLAHRVTGETIDVDFFGPTADVISGMVLPGLSALAPVSRAARGTIARATSVGRTDPAVLDELCDNGVVVPLDSRSSHVFRLSRDVLEQIDAVDAFCQGWERGTSRVWLASLAGDWLAAHEAALTLVDEPIVTLTSECAGLLCARRSDDLLSERASELAQADALHALADLDARVLPTQLARALERPISAVTSAAIEVIGCRSDAFWCPAVYRLIQRLDPDGPSPEPYLWSLCVEYLLIHEYRPEETRAFLSGAGGPKIGTAAPLALEYAPNWPCPFFAVRYALESP